MISRKTPPVRSLALLLASAALVFACNDEAGTDQAGVVDAGPRVAPDRLVLPFVVSRQGALQDQGREQARGALVAAQQLNSLGGILGRQVAIEFLEDNSDPATAAGLAGRLTELSPPIVLGPTGSPAAAALRQALPNQLFISPSATSPVLDVAAAGGVPPASMLFRTAPSDTLLAKAIALLASFGDPADPTQPACDTLSIINSDDDYGRPIADRVEQLFKATAKVVSKRTPVPGTLQSPAVYEAVAQGILGIEKSCQLVIAPSEIAADYMRAFRRSQSQIGGDWSAFQTFGANALRTEAFLRASRQDPAVENSPSLAEGIKAVAAESEPEGTNFSAYRSMYQAQFPSDPIGRSANAYDAVIITALALESAGAGADQNKLRVSLENVSKFGTAYGPGKVGEALVELRRGIDIDYVGASGLLDFDNKGQVLADFLVWRVAEGKFVYSSRFVRSELQ